MALVITAGTPATATATAGGVSEVIASGDFGGNIVQILVNQSGADPAPAYTFKSPGAISLQTVSGTEITAQIIGGNTNTIDVSVS